MAIITVDPGVSTGWCEFRLGGKRPQVLAAGVIDGNKGAKRWELKAAQVCSEFALIVRTKQPQQVWFEQPEAFSSASTITGSQFKLDALCGMLIGVCIIWRVPWFLIRVRDWKGQVPKHVSNQRTRVAMGLNGRVLPNIAGQRKALPSWYPRSEHSWDALGLAVYVNRKLHNQKEEEA